jgi:hypothetical protein
MKTLKELIYNILLNQPETRDSDKKLIWEVYRYKGLTAGDMIDKNDFFNGPTFEGIRRCRQALQRSDLLTGTKLIQPTPKVKKQRQILANENGFSYIAGKLPVWNPEKQIYETN